VIVAVAVARVARRRRVVFVGRAGLVGPRAADAVARIERLDLEARGEAFLDGN